MDLSRLNPVTLITGAAAGLGAACARDFARRSQGGLILIDANEDALAAIADDIDAPERVSTLAFDITDADRWAQASDFIHSQYGRLDWAVVSTGLARASTSQHTGLIDWSNTLDGAVLTLRTVMPLMGANLQGGAIVVSAPASAMKADGGAASKGNLMQLMRVAAKEGAPNNVRVNAISPGGAETSATRKLPVLQELVRETGSEREAFLKIATQPTGLARYALGDDVSRLITMLLSDECPATGVTLLVDGGYTL